MLNDQFATNAFLCIKLLICLIKINLKTQKTEGNEDQANPWIIPSLEALNAEALQDFVEFPLSEMARQQNKVILPFDELVWMSPYSPLPCYILKTGINIDSAPLTQKT